MQLITTPWEESSSICSCCGNQSKTVWGDVSTSDETIAIYYVQWTVDSPDHYPNFDLIIGPWGEDANPKDRILASLLYRPSREGGRFMIVDSESRPANTPDMCGQALKRDEILGTPIAEEVFSLIDAICIQDPRISAINDLNQIA